MQLALRTLHPHPQFGQTVGRAPARARHAQALNEVGRVLGSALDTGEVMQPELGTDYERVKADVWGWDQSR
jgi:hypothetical protein